MLIETLSSLDEVASLEPLWNGLLAESGSGTVFLTHEWASSFLRWIATSAVPMVLLARDGGDVVGIAPLMITPRVEGGRTRRRLEFIGVPNSDYSDFIVRGVRTPVLRAFFKEIARRRRDWDEVSLTEIPDGSPTVEAARALFGRPWTPGLVRAGSDCPTLVFDGHEDEILRTLARKRYIGKRDLQKSLAHVRSHGELTFSHCESAEDAARVLPHLYRLHRARWADTATPSKFEDPSYERFYAEVFERLWPKGQVAITAMELDHQPIAVSFAFPFGRTWTNHNWAYDFDHSRFSPGSLLIQFMISDAMAQGFEEFDFTRGDEPYKSRFANHVKRNTDLLLYGDRATYLQEWTGGVLGQATRRVATSHPAVHGALRTAKRTLRDVRRRQARVASR